MNKAKTLLILALLIGVFAVLFITIARNALDKPRIPESEENDIACTMDAMECPDGTFVGRVAPSCEFAACPGN